jgi:hypothetical protein
LAASVLILYLLPFRPKYFHLGMAFYPVSQVFYWIFISRFLMLTFVGIRPVQEPYQFIGQIRRLIYFIYFPLHCLLERGWDIIIRYLQFRLREQAGKDGVSGTYDGSRELIWRDLGGVN